LNPKAFNPFFEHTYQAVIKSHLAKTAVAIKNVVISNFKKIGDMKVLTRIEVHSVQAANGMSERKDLIGRYLDEYPNNPI
jgi:hypothetical protein